MKVELPQDYVPPQPTHPTYGYLTPEELDEFEAQERTRLGIVPAVEHPDETVVEQGGAVAAVRPGRSSSLAASPSTDHGLVREPAALRPGEDEILGEVIEAEILAEPGEVVEGHPAADGGGWVPSEPAFEEDEDDWSPRPDSAEGGQRASLLGQVTDYRWDAYRQEWVSRTATRVATTPTRGGRPVVTQEPDVDVAAAAGGRGASSSWTSADGQTYRWDAAGQKWIVEGPSA